MNVEIFQGISNVLKQKKKYFVYFSFPMMYMNIFFFRVYCACANSNKIRFETDNNNIFNWLFIKNIKTIIIAICTNDLYYWMLYKNDSNDERMFFPIYIYRLGLKFEKYFKFEYAILFYIIVKVFFCFKITGKYKNLLIQLNIFYYFPYILFIPIRKYYKNR